MRIEKILLLMLNGYRFGDVVIRQLYTRSVTKICQELAVLLKLKITDGKAQLKAEAYTAKNHIAYLMSH